MARSSNRKGDDGTSVKIRRGRVSSVDIFEIKDNELDILEKGSPADLQLNFAIFLFSIAASGGCSLATATFTNKLVEQVFLIVTIVGFILSAYLFVAWLRNRTSLKTLCARIRGRLAPENMSQAEVRDDAIPEKVEEEEANSERSASQ